MLCNEIKLDLKQGANPSIINSMIMIIKMIDDQLFKSYRYKNKKLYLKLGYHSDKCNEIKQKLMNVYNRYYVSNISK